MKQVAVLTLRKARGLYQEAWKRAWPFDDKYLSELWLEARAACGPGRGRQTPSDIWDFCLDLMRETDEFEVIP